MVGKEAMLTLHKEQAALHRGSAQPNRPRQISMKRDSSLSNAPHDCIQASVQKVNLQRSTEKHMSRRVFDSSSLS